MAPLSTTEEKIAFLRGLVGSIRGVAGKAPNWFQKGFKATPGGSTAHEAWGAMRSAALKQPDDPSLFMWPVRAASEKILGKDRTAKIRGGLFDYFHAPAMAVDTTLGRGLQKIPFSKNLFTIKEKVPVGSGMEQTVQRASALAPLAKARDVAEPLLIAAGAERGIQKLRDMRQDPKDIGGMQTMNVDRPLREKVASVMLHLHEENKEHEKRGQALRLLYKQAELGYAEFPQTYSELETKLAELVNEDLVVLGKALELAGGNVKLGELTNKDPKDAVNSAEKFQAIILGD
jgi:hypothetical protein